MPVRAATRDDVPELVRLRRVMFDAMGVDHSDPAWVAACEAMLRDGIADGTVAAFVVDRAGGGLCACGVGLVAYRLPGPGNPSGRNGHVQSMATDPDARGQGHGRAVFEALLEWFAERGVNAVDLYATRLGEPLYRSYGFSEPGNLVLYRQLPP